MKYLVLVLVLSAGCIARPIRYDIPRKTMAEQQMDRLDNNEQTLINQAKEAL